MEFSSPLFRMVEFFLFLKTKTLQCKIFIFDLIQRIHGTGRSVRTVHIIFARSLHDCKIVNTDYLLTLFYLELYFIWKVFERLLKFISKWLTRMAQGILAVSSCPWCLEGHIWDSVFFVLCRVEFIVSFCKCFRLWRKPWGL